MIYKNTIIAIRFNKTNMSDIIKKENEFNELDKIIIYWFDRTAKWNTSLLNLNQMSNLKLLIKQYTESHLSKIN